MKLLTLVFVGLAAFAGSSGLTLDSTVHRPMNAPSANPRNCKEVMEMDAHSTSGVQKIHPASGPPISVYCDQETDGGGWTVIQRRKDGSEDFNRTWEEYKQGFGNLSGEFWLGLTKIYHLTTNGSYDLRVDLTDFDGSTAYALYRGFSVSGPNEDFTLHLDGYVGGTAGDSLIVGEQDSHNNQPFSTADHYHNQNGTNCAEETHGGWWYNDCYRAILNGVYGEYIIWHSWKDDWRWLRRDEMKIRPSN